jgi:biotin/methionine sulfoxide reductase
VLQQKGLSAPAFDDFWNSDGLMLPQLEDDGGYLRAFRNDPQTHPLKTPSGRLEIYSDVISDFREPDCPGHPTWLGQPYPPDAETPFVLISNQPRTRLHSQLDFGGHSSDAKHRGREVMTIHPDDATAFEIAEGDIVRLSNTRGSCLAAARLSDGIRKGAWYAPEDAAQENAMCVHGNPNVLTRDIGTSALAQGCTGQLTTVKVERFDGLLPEMRAFDPPLPS